uniref:nucleoside hydrolase n=1 Tax=Streptomyces recifensis TaxID=67355 RepID=UPI001ABF47AF
MVEASVRSDARQEAAVQPVVPVIIDCDTGVDDALALLLAVRHPGLDLRAVTCVAGNTDVDGVVRNTLTVLEQAGAPDIPVARGAERPLLE